MPHATTRKHRLTHRLAWRLAAIGAGVLAFAAMASPAAAAGAADENWDRSVEQASDARALGLPGDAGPRRLAAAAIEQSANRLVDGGRLGAVRFDREVVPAARQLAPVLRFRQTLGDLRVLWSELDVAVAGDTVESISGTVVPLRSSALAGERRINPRRARAIARGAVADPGIVRRAEPVAYAGEPSNPRRPRRAYVVEVYDAVSDGVSDSDTAWCIVVDAETGNVLKRWRGLAARPPAARDAAGQPGLGDRAARGAASKTVQIQYVDGGGEDVIISTNYRDIWTDKDPLAAFNGSAWPVDGHLRFDQFGTLDSTALAAIPNTYAVARFFCMSFTLRFCGRDGGADGSYNRHFVTANWGGSEYAKYSHATERIFLSPAVSDRDDVGIIAHEFGHQIDIRSRNDYLATTEGEEVKEAIADMFSYAFEQDSRDAELSKPSIKRVLADPNGFLIGGVRLPDHMDEYNCTEGLDEHVNGYILSHAYYLLVERVGHFHAGAILRSLPARLPAVRTFGTIRAALATSAGSYRDGTMRADVDAAFDQVGVTSSTNANSGC